MGSDKYPWVKVNKRDYEEFSKRLAKSKKEILGSPFIIFLAVSLVVPLLLYALINLKDGIGYHLVLVILFVCGTIILGTKAYRGIIKRRVRIIKYRNEAGSVGVRITETSSGAEALIAGIVFLVLGLCCFWLAVKYLVLIIEALN